MSSSDESNIQPSGDEGSVHSSGDEGSENSSAASNAGSDESIIGFQQRTRYTAHDYRGSLNMNADRIRQFRALSTEIEDDEDFCMSLLAMILILSNHYGAVRFKNNYDSRIYQPRDHSSDSSTAGTDSTDGTDSSSSDSSSSNTSSSSSNTNSSSSNTSSSSSNTSSTTTTNTDNDSDTDTDTSSSDSDSSSFDSEYGAHQIVRFFNRIDDLESFNELQRFDGGQDNRYAQIISVFSLILGLSILDLEQLLDSLIDISAIRTVDWDQVRLSTQSRKRNRTIQEYSRHCYAMTRLTADQLQQLNTLFFGRFDSESYTYKRNRFTYEETLLVALQYMSTGTKYYEMHFAFGHDWTRYSLMVNWFAKFIHHKYYHRLSGRSLEYFFPPPNVSDIVSQYRESLYRYVVYDNGNEAIDELADVELETYRSCAILDCMKNAMCQPGSGPIDRNDDRYANWELHRAFYTSYGSVCGV